MQHAAPNRQSSIRLWFISMVVVTIGLFTVEAKKQAGNDEIVFDKLFIDRAIVAAELSHLVSEDDEEPIDRLGEYTSFETLQGVGNKAIVAKRDGVCYAAYSSVNPNRFQELMQRIFAFFTLDFDNFTNLCFENCCKVRTPVERQFDTLFSDVEPLVEKCRDSCGQTTPCPLILTGHHEGGAVAYAAGVQFEHANPTGYTFGAPQVFRGDCKALDSTRWYRFVNSRESQHRREYGIPPGGLVYDLVPLSYDAVPAKEYLMSKHIGFQLTMALDHTIANLGLDANKNLRTTSGVAGAMVLEDPDRYQAGYLDRLRFIRDHFATTGEYPIPDGYYQRDICTLDEECQEGLLCHKLCTFCPPRCDPPEAKKKDKSN